MRMPSETFFNLSYAKRTHIEEAAKQVFLTKPYQQVTVSSIVKAAGIPRGSFYQYFTDLDDVYHHLFQAVIERFTVHSEQQIYAYKGNTIFEYMSATFESDYDFLKQSDYFTLMKKFYQARDFLGLNIDIMDKRNQIVLKTMFKHLNFDQLSHHSKARIIKIIKLLSHVKYHHISKIIKNSASFQEAYDDYQFYLTVMKEGAE